MQTDEQIAPRFVKLIWRVVSSVRKCAIKLENDGLPVLIIIIIILRTQWRHIATIPENQQMKTLGTPFDIDETCK
jgi:hypothetical protein